MPADERALGIHDDPDLFIALLDVRFVDRLTTFLFGFYLENWGALGLSIDCLLCRRGDLREFHDVLVFLVSKRPRRHRCTWGSESSNQQQISESPLMSSLPNA